MKTVQWKKLGPWSGTYKLFIDGALAGLVQKTYRRNLPPCWFGYIIEGKKKTRVSRSVWKRMAVEDVEEALKGRRK